MAMKMNKAKEKAWKEGDEFGKVMMGAGEDRVNKMLDIALKQRDAEHLMSQKKLLRTQAEEIFKELEDIEKKYGMLHQVEFDKEDFEEVRRRFIK